MGTVGANLNLRHRNQGTLGGDDEGLRKREGRTSRTERMGGRSTAVGRGTGARRRGRKWGRDGGRPETTGRRRGLEEDGRAGVGNRPSTGFGGTEVRTWQEF